jgi:hypothetical protein
VYGAIDDPDIRVRQGFRYAGGLCRVSDKDESLRTID